jgi:ribosomal protein S18 acetylase RimI-like enzyme
MPESDPEPPVSRPVLRTVGAADLDFVMATERLPGYDELVAQWTREAHLAALGLPDTHYLIGGWCDAAPQGFAILEQVTDVHLGAKLKRIAVTTPGAGFGRPFLAEVIGWVFANTPAERLWLDVFTYNERARHVYRRAGFREDGLLRQAYVLPDGRRVDRVLMSLLRREWRS